MNRSNLGLFLLLLSLSGFYFGSKIYRLKSEGEEIQRNRYFPEIEQADVQRINVKSREPSFEYSIVRRGELWFLDGHLASFEKSPQLVNSLIELSRERVMNPNPSETEIDGFGLDDPAYRIEIFTNDGSSLGWAELGSRDPQGNHFYGRFKSTGQVCTVPAYLLSPLEEEPEKLREKSPFPIEAAAVRGFQWTLNGRTTSFQDEGDAGIRILGDPPDRADKKALHELFYKLKDLKVARFLGDDEETSLGDLTVSYRASFDYTDRNVIVEFGSRVSITPKLIYGRRYLSEENSTEPIDGTLERFVLELPPSSELLAPDLDAFRDRSAFELSVDDVYKFQVFTVDSQEIAFSDDGKGSWLKTSDGREEAVSAQKVTGFLYALRDLRRDESGEGEPSSDQSTRVELRLKDGSDLSVRFGIAKTGKPYFWQGKTAVLLEEGSWKLLSEALDSLVQSSASAQK